MLDYIKNEIFPHFCPGKKILNIKTLNSGHINNTFCIETEDITYVLQQINKNVFKKPLEVMSNIITVTEYLKKKIAENGGDVERETLTFIKADNGDYCYISPKGEYFRMYIYISDVTTYQIVEKPEHFRYAAIAFGKFQNMLSDFPAFKLHETIENFHHTPLRLAALERAIAEDKMGRAKNVAPEIEFALKRKPESGILIDAIAKGEIPVRVTHNDTKLNNVLIDNKTQQAICVIDLDTVMPGSMLYDFGDSIRFGTNPVAEDEPDTSKVVMDMELYKAYTEGFLFELRNSITPNELKLLPLSAKIMTLECGVRFLTDYLEGDTYFKTSHADQNLHRARTQFKLVADMEQNMRQMERIAYDSMR